MTKCPGGPSHGRHARRLAWRCTTIDGKRQRLRETAAGIGQGHHQAELARQVEADFAEGIVDVVQVACVPVGQAVA